jgi:hypothetical protein
VQDELGLKILDSTACHDRRVEVRPRSTSDRFNHCRNDHGTSAATWGSSMSSSVADIGWVSLLTLSPKG